MMQRILIVDDEPLFREGLVNTIDWNSLGIEVAGEAFNGKEALYVLSQTGIDLVLTDIRMPEMDGLELIRRASDIYPDLHFIVLSAYDEFHQVKKAFQLGIADYILKSEINTAELGEVIKRQRVRISAESDRKSSGRESLVRKNESLLLQQLLKNSIERRLAWKDMPELQDILRKNDDSPVCSVVISLRSTASGDDDPDEIIRVFSEAFTLADNYLAGRQDWLYYRDMQQFVLFYIPEHNSSGNLDWQTLGRLTEELRLDLKRDVISQFPGMTVCAGFADPDCHETLWRKKHEAERSCSFSFFRGSDRTIAFIHYKRSLDYSSVKFSHKFREFSLLLEKRDWNQLRQDISSFQLPPLRCSGADLDEAENLFRRYYFFMISLTGKLGMDDCSEVPVLLEKYKCLEASRAVLEEYNQWLKDCVQMICSKGESRFNISQRVIDYLQKHYARDVSLSSVADALELNPSYVSRIFSKETGSGFSQYLLQFRIRKAIELMEESPERTYEIAEKVGFTNPESFCRGFKKITGVSPGKYCQKK